MIGEEALRVFVLLGAAGGCMPSNSSSNPDAKTAPIIMYEPFTSTTWSLSITGSAAQISISDVSGPAACALSTSQQQTLPTGGRQIILRLPGPVSGICPAKASYTLSTHCAATLGSEAYVTEGCAYYRKWDAQGAPLGIAAALSGEFQISGTDTACTIRANVGFLGATFNEIFVLMNGAGMQPWCGE